MIALSLEFKVISKRPTAHFGRLRALREIESLAREPSLEWLRAPRDTLKGLKNRLKE